MNNRDGEIQTWIGIFIVLGLAVLVSVLSGCASNQSVEVTAVYSGERPEVQACLKVNMP